MSSGFQNGDKQTINCRLAKFLHPRGMHNKKIKIQMKGTQPHFHFNLILMDTQQSPWATYTNIQNGLERYLL